MAWSAPGLMMPGSRAAERFLFRLSPNSPGIEQTRALLKAAFPDALIADYRESHPSSRKGLNRATTFLSLVSLITLIIGAIGVGTAMRAHIQQRMDSIAIMKCIGARSSHVMRIYLLQTIALGLAGGLLGVALRTGGAARLSVVSRALFRTRAHRALGLRHRRARHRHRDPGVTAVHSAAPDRHPKHSSQPDPAP
jgi:putative ABC transport system permease protein